MGRETLFSRLLSGSLCISVFLTNVVYAGNPGKNIWSERLIATRAVPSQLLTTLEPIRPLELGLRSAIPANLQKAILPVIKALPATTGRISRICIPKTFSGTTIVYVQDIHQNEEAQLNISATLKQLFDHSDIDVVGLEGAFSPLDFSWYHAYADRDVLTMTGDWLRRQNYISGAVDAAIRFHAVDRKLPFFVGIDDVAHYRANRSAYLNSLSDVEHVRREIKKRREQLSRLHISEDLKQFDDKVQDYRRRRISWGDYVQHLEQYAGHCRIQFHDPHLQRYLAVLHQEQALNFAQVQRQREDLFSELSCRLNADSNNLLRRYLQTLRERRMAPADFYSQLESLCVSAGLNLTRYHAFTQYIHYVHAADDLDINESLKESTRLEKEIYQRLICTPQEKIVVDQSRHLYLIDKLANFALTHDEWQEYKQRAFHLKTNLRHFEDFYEEAELRNNAMADHLLNALNKTKRDDHGQNKVQYGVLVTGGFHSTGLTQLLTDRGVAVIHFVPNITKADESNGSDYLGAFARQKTPLDRLFAGEKLFLAKKPYIELASAQALFAATRKASRTDNAGKIWITPFWQLVVTVQTKTIVSVQLISRKLLNDRVFGIAIGTIVAVSTLCFLRRYIAISPSVRPFLFIVAMVLPNGVPDYEPGKILGQLLKIAKQNAVDRFIRRHRLFWKSQLGPTNSFEQVVETFLKTTDSTNQLEKKLSGFEKMLQFTQRENLKPLSATEFDHLFVNPKSYWLAVLVTLLQKDPDLIALAERWQVPSSRLEEIFVTALPLSSSQRAIPTHLEWEDTLHDVRVKIPLQNADVTELQNSYARIFGNKTRAIMATLVLLSLNIDDLKIRLQRLARIYQRIRTWNLGYGITMGPDLVDYFERALRGDESLITKYLIELHPYFGTIQLMARNKGGSLEVGNGSRLWSRALDDLARGRWRGLNEIIADLLLTQRIEILPHKNTGTVGAMMIHHAIAFMVPTLPNELSQIILRDIAGRRSRFKAQYSGQEEEYVLYNALINIEDEITTSVQNLADHVWRLNANAGHHFFRLLADLSLNRNNYLFTRIVIANALKRLILEGGLPLTKSLLTPWFRRSPAQRIVAELMSRPTGQEPRALQLIANLQTLYPTWTAILLQRFSGLPELMAIINERKLPGRYAIQTKLSAMVTLAQVHGNQLKPHIIQNLIWSLREKTNSLITNLVVTKTQSFIWNELKQDAFGQNELCRMLSMATLIWCADRHKWSNLEFIQIAKKVGQGSVLFDYANANAGYKIGTVWYESVIDQPAIFLGALVHEHFHNLLSARGYAPNDDNLDATSLHEWAAMWAFVDFLLYYTDATVVTKAIELFNVPAFSDEITVDTNEEHRAGFSAFYRVWIRLEELGHPKTEQTSKNMIATTLACVLNPVNSNLEFDQMIEKIMMTYRQSQQSGTQLKQLRSGAHNQNLLPEFNNIRVRVPTLQRIRELLFTVAPFTLLFSQLTVGTWGFWLQLENRVHTWLRQPSSSSIPLDRMQSRTVVYGFLESLISVCIWLAFGATVGIISTIVGQLIWHGKSGSLQWSSMTRQFELSQQRSSALCATLVALATGIVPAILALNGHPFIGACLYLASHPATNWIIWKSIQWQEKRDRAFELQLSQLEQHLENEFDRGTINDLLEKYWDWLFEKGFPSDKINDWANQATTPFSRYIRQTFALHYGTLASQGFGYTSGKWEKFKKEVLVPTILKNAGRTEQPTDTFGERSELNLHVDYLGTLPRLEQVTEPDWHQMLTIGTSRLEIFSLSRALRTLEKRMSAHTVLLNVYVNADQKPADILMNIRQALDGVRRSTRLGKTAAVAVIVGENLTIEQRDALLAATADIHLPMAMVSDSKQITTYEQLFDAIGRKFSPSSNLAQAYQHLVQHIIADTVVIEIGKPAHGRTAAEILLNVLISIVPMEKGYLLLPWNKIFTERLMQNQA